MILLDVRGHLASDTSLEELHAFAARIGLTRRRFHGVRKGHPHYDLTRWWQVEVAMHGVRPVSSRNLVRRMVRA